jgi:hypothetical protein
MRDEGRDIVSSIEHEYRRYKELAEGAFAQVDERALNAVTSGFNNSIAILVWHVSGNLKSRFTDFLVSDGEKPWRARDEEFVARTVTRSQLLEKWNDGWAVLLSTVGSLADADLSKRVAIRGAPLSVAEALHRSLSHTSYHVGQIVYIAKALRGDDWTFLSIPPGKSADYNQDPARERLRHDKH